jgi:16S rRNA (cytidine1402-2'-O)-methyltransferase
VAGSLYPVIFYESPFRIIKSLKELSDIKKDLEVVVLRELTKKFETIYRGKIEEVIEKINPKGEFVIVVKNK